MAAWLTEGQTGQRFDPVRLHQKRSTCESKCFFFYFRFEPFFFFYFRFEPLTS